MAHEISCAQVTETELAVAEKMTPDEIRQLSVAMMQQASQFSTDNDVAVTKPLNHSDAYQPRQRLITFAINVVDRTSIDTEAGQHWRLRTAEYARRWVESENPARLQMTGNRPEMIAEFSESGETEERFVTNPRGFAERVIAELMQTELFPSVRGPLAYEETYWLTLDGKYAEAKEANLQHALACEKDGDSMGGAIFRMQAAKCGLDGKLEGAVEFLATTYEDVLLVLQDNRESQLAQSWMKVGGTMDGHISQALAMDANLALRLEALKGNLVLARAGTYVPPSIGGM